jgi:amino acid adenylation domain-containing protein
MGLTESIQDRPWNGQPGESARIVVVTASLGDAARRLLGTANSEGLSLAQALMTVFVATIHSWANMEELVFVTPVDVRKRLDRDAWGMGVNAIPVRTHLSPDYSFKDLATEVRAAFLRSYRHRRTAVTDAADAVGMSRRSDGSSVLTDFELNIMPRWTPPADFSRRGLTARILPQLVVRPQYDVSLSAAVSDDDVDLCWQVRGGIEAAETVAVLHRLFERFAAAWCDDASSLVTRVQLVDDETEPQLLQAGSGPTRPIDPRTPAERVLEQAACRPTVAAVITEKGTITYNELARHVARFRSTLAAQGVGPGVRVAVHLDRGVSLVVAMLALWAESAVYVPIDRANPPARVAAMLHSTGPKILVTDGTPDTDVATAAATLGTAVVDVAAPTPADVARRPVGSVQDPRSPVYVMFTSGSTGQPKALEIHLEGFSNHLDEMIRVVELDENDVFGQLAPLGFDVHIWQLISPLAVGGTLRIFSASELRDPIRLAELARTSCVTVMQAVPSYLEQWCHLGTVRREHAALPGLRALFVTGEAFPSELVARLPSLFPNATFVNAYGPAEASDDVTLHVCTSRDSGAVVPIGTAIANCRLYILDRWQRLRPPGLRGELAIGGTGVGNGYLEPDARPAFRPDPWLPGGRLYLTGDVCSMRGELARFHGRFDHQVKLGGRRVELEEIENACMTLDGVASAAVCLAHVAGTEVLVGFLAGALDDAIALRRALRDRLPAFMVPGTLIICDELPLTPNGKVDRRALAARAAEFLSERHTLAGSHEVVRAAWERVLGVAGIDASDNFFALGGDSLSVMRVIAELEREGIPAEIADLYNAPTLRGFAEAVLQDDKDEPFTGRAALPSFVQWHMQAPSGPFVLAVRCYVRANPAAIRVAIDKVVRKHPVLGMTIVPTISGWQLDALPGAGGRGIEVSSPGELEEAAIGAITPHCLFSWTASATSLDVELCLAAHHAVLDQQGWLVVLGDLERALQGRPVTGRDWAYPAFCRQHGATAPAASRLLALNDTPVIESFELPLPGKADRRLVEATVVAAIARWAGAFTGRSEVRIAVEHDLRFTPSAEARGVGCYAAADVTELDAGTDAHRLVAACASAMERPPAPSLAIPLDVDVLVNRHLTLAAIGEHHLLTDVQWAASVQRRNAASTPALVTADILHDAERGALRVTLIVSDAARARPTASKTIEEDARGLLAQDRGTPLLEGTDLLDLSGAALANLLARLAETDE